MAARNIQAIRAAAQELGCHVGRVSTSRHLRVEIIEDDSKKSCVMSLTKGTTDARKYRAWVHQAIRRMRAKD